MLSAITTPPINQAGCNHPSQRTGRRLLLCVKDLKKVYGGRAVVDGVSMTVGDGEIVGLLGPNGAGKTTTFYMIAGLVPPNAGSVIFSGKDITSLPMHKRARIGMGYLPQEESIFRKMTVQENLLAVLETRKNLNRNERKEKAEQLMERFRITKLRDSLALTLSGGEKRRLTIARCLCTNPKLLMLDEPFAGVDPKAVEAIHTIVRELRDNDGLSILITDHHVRETLKIVDHAYVMDDGKAIIEGTAEQIANDPLARKHYLGEDFTL
ncbi:LPS export ABC transporter ATP-binding protein [Rubritalea profundi]|uniref:LPS export ABC transporter ATP-binding protein n=1 Tax=Rubritalea profundi TaxID=1658618 RepID=UPI000CF41197|nr:LPS export ABC transporter ATP-binding protein [Rubritalea profundi]